MEKKMLLQELSDHLAARELITKKRAEQFARAFFDVIEEGIASDSFVKVKGFGTFKMVEISERESVDVNTGERIQINSHERITFTPDATLKNLINAPFAHFQTIVLNDDTDINELESVETEELPVPLVQGDLTPNGNSAHEDHDRNTLSNRNEHIVTIENNDDTPPHDETPIIEAIEKQPISHESTTEGLQSENNTHANTEEETEENVKETIEEMVEVVDIDNTNNEQLIMIEEKKTSLIVPPSVTPEVTYVVREKEHKFWKRLAIALITLMLMAASYLAGHLHLLWPQNSVGEVPMQQVQTTKIAAPAIPHKLHKAAHKCDTVAQSAVKVAQQPTEAPLADKPVSKPSAAPKTANTTTNDPATAYQQIPDGKYVIVGTRGTHTLRHGETIRTVALNVYGSKGFAPYIILHNKLENPDNVEIGTVLQLPDIKHKKNYYKQQ